MSGGTPIEIHVHVHEDRDYCPPPPLPCEREHHTHPTPCSSHSTFEDSDEGWRYEQALSGLDYVNSQRIRSSGSTTSFSSGPRRPSPPPPPRPASDHPPHDPSLHQFDHIYRPHPMRRLWAQRGMRTNILLIVGAIVLAIAATWRSGQPLVFFLVAGVLLYLNRQGIVELIEWTIDHWN